MNRIIASVMLLLSLINFKAFSQENLKDFDSIYSKLVFTEEFNLSTTKQWYLGNNNYSINNGLYQISKANKSMSAALDFDNTKAYEVKTTTWSKSGDQIIFGIGSELGKNYQLIIKNDSVKILVGSDTKKNWSYVPNLNIDLPNTLTIRRFYNKVIFFVNEELVGYYNQSHNAEGKRILLGSNSNSVNGKVFFDNVKINSLYSLPIKPYIPIIEMAEIFPSYVISTATQNFGEQANQEDENYWAYMGDVNGQIGVKLRNTFGDKAKITVSVNSPSIMQESVFTGTMTENMREYEIFPVIKYLFTDLENVKKDKAIWVSYKVWVNDIYQGEQVVNTKLHKIYDCPYVFRHRRGFTQDLRHMFAAYVDEDAPYITQVLLPELKTENKDLNLNSRFELPFAIFSYLKEKGFSYSSVTGLQDSPRVAYQSIRTLDETVKARQANCIDGTTLFASILYRMGIEPYIMLQPGHAYIGWYNEPPTEEELVTYDVDKMSFLETTMLDSKISYSDLKPLFKEDKESFKLIKLMKRKVDDKKFEQFLSFFSASLQGKMNVQKAILDSANNPENRDLYQILSVAQVRKMGIGSLGGK
jgi:hypothetical protein